MGGLVPFGQGPLVRGHRGCPTPAHRNKQIEAAKQYASVLFPAPELIGLLRDLNVPKGGLQHVSELMTRRGAAHTAPTGLPFPRPIRSRDRFMDKWKELVNPLALDRLVPVADPTSGRCWPLQSWAHYIKSRPPVVDTIHWKQPPPLSSSVGMPTRASVEVGRNFPLGSTTTAQGAHHPPTYG